MFRSVVGGGKGGGSAYDPQIGRAAARSAAVAQQAQNFAETYYKDVVTPLIRQQSEASIDAQQKLGNLYDINAAQMKLSNDRYLQRGIPAEDRYYEMTARYSEPAEMERQATAAMGDFQTAAAGQQANMMRQYAGLGIDPTSPAAQAAMADMAVANTAVQAGAMNRARNAARTLGMQLTSDAANFGRGGQSSILQFGAGAQGNATGAFGVANAALGTGMQAGSGVMQGYQTAMSGYNNIMDNYTKMGTADIQAQAASSPLGGLGSLAGSVFSAAGAAGGFGKLFSDRRLKTNVEIVGQLPSGLTVYEFDYIWGGERQRGVMAQEVIHVLPDAVVVGDDGYMMVDYGKVQ